MKTILTTLNAKFIHSSLALRDLKVYCKSGYPEVVLLEYTINDSLDSIIADLVGHHPDLLGFSCYIWNIRQTFDIIDTVKKVMPGCRILLGGPEVSYDSADIMKKNPLVDFIVFGEGEETFRQLMDCLSGNRDLAEVDGLVWRSEGKVLSNQERLTISLDSIPFPYESGLEALHNKIIYYETSRGCPYHCQYCLSSTTGRVRFLSLDRVKKEMALFVASGVKQVKLVDRTFNCSPARAKDIFRYLIQLDGTTNFHFEMAGDLIDEEMLEILKTAPNGMFQFEIGVQSTGEDTLSAIQRRTDISKIEAAVTKLMEMDNIHIHLDLIAGLPEEDLPSIARSVNQVLKMSPHRLQLGFLKLLKGSGLRIAAEKYNYSYTSYPPYEVLSNHVLSFLELDRIKKMETLIELYYNTHRFQRTLEYLTGEYDYFSFFNGFAEDWERKGFFKYSHSNVSLYEYLFDYVVTLDGVNEDLLRQLLCFDFVTHEKPGKVPRGLELLPEESANYASFLHDYLRQEENLEKLLPEWKGYSPKQILRQVHIQVFDYHLQQNGAAAYEKGRTIVLIDYRHRQGVLNKPKVIPLNI